MSKITLKTPIVELDGDEMTRVLWALVKEKLLLPFIDLKVDYYDLGLEKPRAHERRGNNRGYGRNKAARRRGKVRYYYSKRRASD